MKKLLSFVLAAVLSLGCLCVGAVAEEYDEELVWDLDYMCDTYYECAETFDGYFAENTSPSAEAIDMYLRYQSYYYYLWEDYIVEEDEFGNVVYHIPADEYEEHVLWYFSESDDIIDTLRASDFYKTDYYRIVDGNSVIDDLPVTQIKGYKDVSYGAVVVYAYILEYYYYDDDDNFTYYTPAEDEVEGEDYIYVYDYVIDDDEETETSYGGIGYIPAKIVGGVKFATGKDTGILYSFENVGKEEVVCADDMILTPMDSFDMQSLFSRIVMEGDSFERGALVNCYYYEMYYEDDAEVYNAVAEIMKDRGEIFTVEKYMAFKDGKTTEPVKPLPLIFALPNDFSPDFGVYRITEDGEAVELECEVYADEYGWLYAETNIDELGMFTVAGIRYGDVNEDHKVNLSDVSAMLKSIAKWDVTVNGISADANRDDKVSLSDVSLIMKYIAGWNIYFG
ncbi:MAG: hypothetical protein E7578_07080 [Ruminococcaceae bacterium]|nr:hypothetical protein [Oscillospiraceae bacterium]